MPTITRNRTFSPRPRDIERRWYVVDADGAVLGRLASEVAKILRGKHKPMFAPHMDTGDHVIVVNARGVRLTAGKESRKMLVRHSGYPGGLRAVEYGKVLAERPATAVERAVRGMLPKNRLGRQMLRKLAVYEGPDHPHQAQKPVPLGLGEIPKWEGLPVIAPKPPKAEPARKLPTKAEEAKPRRVRGGRPARPGSAKEPAARKPRGAAKAPAASEGRKARDAKAEGRRRSRASGESKES